MTRTDILASIEASALVAIVRGNFQPEQVLEIGHALVRGGISAIEVTLNSDRALEAISLLEQNLGDNVLIGAGTVVAPDQVDEAVAAGARYLIAPGLDSACVERARRRGVPFIPGVFTATEIGLALANSPSLLLLDEPLAGMSPRERVETVKLLRSISKGRTAIIIDHDMDSLFELVEHVTVLQEGRVLVEGPPEQIKSN
ncbi:MAG TPA: hypothetical protein PLT07_10095, partial [Trueperaceae bacterium]|nr:hypothetical protein [Trueperaceae bacterium]